MGYPTQWYYLKFSTNNSTARRLLCQNCVCDLGFSRSGPRLKWQYWAFGKSSELTGKNIATNRSDFIPMCHLGLTGWQAVRNVPYMACRTRRCGLHSVSGCIGSQRVSIHPFHLRSYCEMPHEQKTKLLPEIERKKIVLSNDVNCSVSSR